MGGGASKEVTTASPSTPGWNPQREEWWTSVSSSYENITSIGDALTSCYSLLEASWSTRSENYKFLSETKLRHALSSCKTFLNLSIAKELHRQESEAQYWFNVNLISSALSTVLFIAITFTIARLRRLTILRQRMKRYMPNSWFEKKTTPTSWFKKSPSPTKTKPTFSTQLPVQITPEYHLPNPYHLPLTHQAQQGMPGAPPTPYPVAAYRNSHNVNNVVNNVHGDRHLPNTRGQAEATDYTEQVATIDRQIAMIGSAGRARGGRGSQAETD